MADKQLKAYQCDICNNCHDDDMSDRRFCSAGLWPGCGEAETCRQEFSVIAGEEANVAYNKKRSKI